METKARHPPKREWSCMCWPQTVALSLSFLTHSSLVLCSASVLVNTGSLSWYLQHNQVGSSIHAVARRFAITREHQNSQVRDWCPILFSDESRFTLSTCDRRERVWRHRGERYAACNIIQQEVVRLNAGAVGPGFLLVQRALGSSWCSGPRVFSWCSGPRVPPGAAGPGFLLVQRALGSSWCSGPWVPPGAAGPGFSPGAAGPGFLLVQRAPGSSWCSGPRVPPGAAGPGFLLEQRALGSSWCSGPWVPPGAAGPGFLLVQRAPGSSWCSESWVPPGAAGPGFLLVQRALGSSWCRTRPGLMWPECGQFLDDEGCAHYWVTLWVSPCD